MTKYELGLQNLKNDLIKMGLSSINVDAICKSLDKQNRWLSIGLDRSGLSSDEFVNLALCWSATTEGSDYWSDLTRELLDYLNPTDMGYVLGRITQKYLKRDPLFIMKPIQNFNILD